MAVLRTFKVGQKVLAFLPSHGNPLQKRYSGPYVIKEKLSPLNYVLETPDRRKKSQLVHINLIRNYLSRTSSDEPREPVVALCVTMVPHTVTAEEEIDEETDGENILTVDLPTSNGFFPNVAFSQIFNPIVQNKKTPSAKILSSCCQSILKSQLIVWVCELSFLMTSPLQKNAKLPLGLHHIN
ncbi:hypothetical protein Pmani_004397 [Petrolisthes manimaculis]|uniref:Integrase p58-like C-terminal domain-containing protein n=1 Tax=Petrolisthes manimaculis TaxID=1843537 RepID=A0AAE1Q9C3_9EUCA|nr:hypothetical protein Pmani_010804 [Petrolisthes manimaculis]KAK4322136.1 hypothetical protein Pmani_007089 [Petrolisthes manimaculis]KAK4325015.1 hypothetical protein Pmani_004397 [Petrolisthes manimaculis]